MGHSVGECISEVLLLLKEEKRSISKTKNNEAIEQINNLIKECSAIDNQFDSLLKKIEEFTRDYNG